MIVVDENFVADQRELLRAWRIPFRQIGLDLGRTGMQDDEIPPLLISLPRPTFITRDLVWYRRPIVHPRYSVVVLEVRSAEAAQFTRRVLRHPYFDVEARRLGKLIRASHEGIAYWTYGNDREAHAAWNADR